MYLDIPLISSERLLIRPALQDDLSNIIRYYRENQSFLVPVEPRWPDNFLTESFWRERIETALIEYNYRQSLKLFLFEKTEAGRVVGAINFSQFIYGSAHNCHVGYSLDKAHQGQGYMTEALQAALKHVFDTYRLHRVMAAYMPRNQRSGNLLKRLGFVVEGYARDYLMINGKWEDHILTSLVNPNWEGES